MNTFTWVKTHHEIVEYLRTQRNNQPHLVEILRKVGINGLHDENKSGERGGKKTSGLAAVFAHLSTHIIAVEDDLLRSGVSICSKASKVYTCV